MAVAANETDPIRSILAERRRRYFEEMDRDPALRAYVRGLAAAENGGHPEGIIERLVNGADMNGRASLWDEIRSGFYGPVNRGTVREMPASPAYDAALERVRSGSNDIGLLTDQGMRAEHKPAAAVGIEPTLIRGEYYSPMGRKGLEWKSSVEQAAAERAATVSQGPNAVGDAGARETLDLLPRSLLATAGEPAATAAPVAMAAASEIPASSAASAASGSSTGADRVADLDAGAVAGSPPSGDPVAQALRLAGALGNGSGLAPMSLRPAHLAANPGAMRMAESAGLYGLGSRAGFAAGGGIGDDEASGGLDTGDNLPETLPSLMGQQEQLIEGRRPAQMFPAGTPELPVPTGMERLETGRGAYHFNPAKVTARDVAAASRSGRENDILGLGPLSKADVQAEMRRTGEPPVVVVERDAAGNEIKASLATPGTAHLQALAIAGDMAPDHVLSIEPLGDVLQGRLPSIDPVDAALRRSRADGGGVDEAAEPVWVVPGNGVGLVGKALGLLGLDAEGARGRQSWTDAAQQSLYDAAHFPDTMLESAAQAVTAPARAYRGEIAPDQMIPEGLNFAGSVALGSAAVPKPMGAAGMGGGRLPQASSHLDMSPEARMARANDGPAVAERGTAQAAGRLPGSLAPNPLLDGRTEAGRPGRMPAETMGPQGREIHSSPPQPMYSDASFAPWSVEGYNVSPSERATLGTKLRAAFDAGQVPDGWYVHGRAKAGDLDTGHVIQATRDPDVALRYAGENGGSVWALQPGEGRAMDFTSINTPDARALGARALRDFRSGEAPMIVDDAISALGTKQPRVLSENIRSSFAPDDIVNSAQAFDNPDYVRWLENRFSPDFVHTPDGAVAINPDQARAIRLFSNPTESAAPGLAMTAAARAENSGKMTGWHTSPHDFERFDTSNVGQVGGASYPGALSFGHTPTGPASNFGRHQYEVSIDAAPHEVLDVGLPFHAQPKEVQDYLLANADRIRSEWGQDNSAMTFGGQPINLSDPTHYAAAILAAKRGDVQAALADIPARMAQDGANKKFLGQVESVLRSGSAPQSDLFHPTRPIADLYHSNGGQFGPDTSLGFKIVRSPDEMAVTDPSRISIVGKNKLWANPETSAAPGLAMTTAAREQPKGYDETATSLLRQYGLMPLPTEIAP